MHRTKIPVRTWCFVLFEMVASKNGVSAREIARKYGITPRSAWFMTQRVREAMRSDPMAGLFSGVVMADETWIGPNPRNFRKGAQFRRNNYRKEHKTPVLSLMHRETGEVRSQVVANVRGATLREAIERQVDLRSTYLHTDEASGYVRIGWKAAGHETVVHARSQYVGKGGATTNHVEGFFSQLKRSLDGTHHAVSVEHLSRYLGEFDYRYSTRKMSDTQRLADLVGRVAGRRLTYRDAPSEPLSLSLVA
jgi:transposase-like protein